MQEQLRNKATLLSKIAKMSEVSLEQLQEELQSFSQVFKEISIPKGVSFEEYMEISEQLKEEGCIAEVPPVTTALVLLLAQTQLPHSLKEMSLVESASSVHSRLCMCITCMSRCILLSMLLIKLL